MTRRLALTIATLLAVAASPLGGGVALAREHGDHGRGRGGGWDQGGGPRYERMREGGGQREGGQRSRGQPERGPRYDAPRGGPRDDGRGDDRYRYEGYPRERGRSDRRGDDEDRRYYPPTPPDRSRYGGAPRERYEPAPNYLREPPPRAPSPRPQVVRPGGYLPPSYRGDVIEDPGRYRLRPPPRGYVWVRVGRGMALVAVDDGQIFDVVPY